MGLGSFSVSAITTGSGDVSSWLSGTSSAELVVVVGVGSGAPPASTSIDSSDD